MLVRAPGSEQSVSRIAVFVRSGEVPKAAAEALGYDGPTAVLADRVDVTPDDTVGTLEISVTDDTPDGAIQIADAFAAQTLTWMRAQAASAAEESEQVQILRDEADRAQANLAALDSQVNDSSGAVLQTRLEAAQDDLRQVLQRLSTARSEARAAAAPLQVVQSAVAVPDGTTGFAPPTSRVARSSLAALGGLALGIVLALLVSRIDTRLRRRAEVQAAYGLPVISEIPSVPWWRRPSRPDTVMLDPADPVADAFRPLRSAISLTEPVVLAPGHDVSRAVASAVPASSGPRVIVVVSARPGEGRTTVAAGFAACLAESGKRVLVVDADVQRPRAHRLLGVPPGLGLTDLDSDDVARLVRASVVPGVRLLQAGAGSHGVALLPLVLPRVVAAARQLADVVVVDCPAMLAGTEAMDAMANADAALVVCRAGRTSRDDAERVSALAGPGPGAGLRCRPAGYPHDGARAVRRLAAPPAGSGRSPEAEQPVRAGAVRRADAEPARTGGIPPSGGPGGLFAHGSPPRQGRGGGGAGLAAAGVRALRGRHLAALPPRVQSTASELGRRYPHRGARVRHTVPTRHPRHDALGRCQPAAKREAQAPDPAHRQPAAARAWGGSTAPGGPVTRARSGTRLAAAVAAKRATIGVVGQGYVGLSVASAAADVGMWVRAVDIDAARVGRLQAGENVVPGVDDVFARGHATGRMTFGTDTAGLADGDVVVICVPTPVVEHRPDLSSSSRPPGGWGSTSRAGTLVVLESTTYPGTTEQEVLRSSRRTACAPDGLPARLLPRAHRPRQREVRPAQHPPGRGWPHDRGDRVAAAFYRQLVDEVLLVSRLPAPPRWPSCSRTPSGWSTSPWSTSWRRCAPTRASTCGRSSTRRPPSRSGSCPSSPAPASAGTASRSTRPTWPGSRAATPAGRSGWSRRPQDINAPMPGYVADRVAEALNQRGRAVPGAKVLALGVTYKPDVGDVRESAAVLVLQQLAARGADLSFHDPFVDRVELRERTLRRVQITGRAIERADCVLLLTAHTQYDVDAIAARSRLLFDARGALRHRDDLAHVVRL